MWDLDEEEEGSINELTSDFGSGGGMTLADRTDAAALAQLNQPQWDSPLNYGMPQTRRKRKPKNSWEDMTTIGLPSLDDLEFKLPKPKRQKREKSSRTGLAPIKSIMLPELHGLTKSRKQVLKKADDDPKSTCYFEGPGYFYKRTRNTLSYQDKLLFVKVKHEKSNDDDNEDNEEEEMEIKDDEKMIDIMLKSSPDEHLGRLDQRLVELLYDYLDHPDVSIEAHASKALLRSPKPDLIARTVKIKMVTTAKVHVDLAMVGKKHDIEIKRIMINEQVVVSINRDNFSSIFGEALENVDDLTGIDPCKDVTTSLMQHQRIGLEWLMKHENPDNETYHHVKKVEERNGEVYWEDTISGEKYAQPPAFPKGGLLADDMGLGKTLQIISLIAGNSKSPNGASLGPTLIVCPLAVMNNWVEQIQNHCTRGALRFLEYHGQDRIGDPDYLKDFHVVITTYDIVQRESKMEETGLMGVRWLRLCLDEAHTIRSRTTKKWRACCALRAERRWALTGTPVQNKLDDLQSLFAFIQIKPWSEYRFWKANVLQMMKNGDSTGIETVKEILKRHCMRRTKFSKINGEPIVDLPDRKTFLCKIEFTTHERKIYDALTKRHLERFKEMQRSGMMLRNSMNILAMLTRKRQACAHIHLLPRDQVDPVPILGASKLDLQTILADNATTECGICDKMPMEPCITKCEHIYCYPCLMDEVENGSEIGKPYKCAICDERIRAGDIVTKQRESEKRKGKRKRREVPDDIKPSSKITALINHLEEGMGGSPVKTVVFSQWTSYLDIIGKCLNRRGIFFARLDGSMSRKARVREIKRFKEDPDLGVFLMSLKAGALGLNLTVAQRVILTDPWWNPATEDQATDRVYRIGQTKDVEVIRLIMKDSVEEGIIEIQERKRNLIAAAGLGQSSGKTTEDKRADLRSDLEKLFLGK